MLNVLRDELRRRDYLSILLDFDKPTTEPQMTRQKLKASKPIEGPMPQRDRDAIVAVHNEAVGRIVTDIVRPTMAAGGTPDDVMVLLERIVTGVLTAVVKLGGDNKLDMLVGGVRERMAPIRLGDAPAGRSWVRNGSHAKIGCSGSIGPRAWRSYHRGHQFPADHDALAVQQIAQHPAAREWIVQMQLIDPSHERQLGHRYRPWLAVQGCGSAVAVLLAPPAADRGHNRSSFCAQQAGLAERTGQKINLERQLTNFSVPSRLRPVPPRCPRRQTRTIWRHPPSPVLCRPRS